MIATSFPILANDLGKYKSVACWYEPSTAEARFESFTTSRAAVRRLLEGRQPTVVIEACT